MMAIGQHPSPLDASGPNLDLRCNFWAGRPKAIKPGRKHYRAGSGRRCRRRKDVKNEGSSGDMYENTRLMNRTSIDETRVVDQTGAALTPRWAVLEPCENNHHERRRNYKTGPPSERWAEKRIPFYTFEAGMCMKTKDRSTQCPNKNRHLDLNFPTFSNKRRPFCTKMQFCDDKMTICWGNPVFCRFPPAPRTWGADAGRGRSARPARRPCGFSASGPGERAAGPESGPCATLAGRTGGHSWPDKRSPLQLNAS